MIFLAKCPFCFSPHPNFKDVTRFFEDCCRDVEALQGLLQYVVQLSDLGLTALTPEVRNFFLLKSKFFSIISRIYSTTTQ